MLARLRFLVAICLALSAAAGACEPPPIDRRIAITIDDLPWASLGDQAPHVPPARMLEHHARLMAALKSADAPVTGFVNEGKLEVDGQAVPERLQMLRDWLDAGAELGNHTHGHTDLHAAGLAAYQADILKGERQLRPLLAERDAKPQWFRHPYLRAGRSVEDKAALAKFLAAHGYRIAPVTVDNSDWIWAAAYRKALNRGDEPTLARLRAEYVPYMLAKLDYYEDGSLSLLGYALPQTWLLHANELNADTYPALVAGVRARGYRIVSLEEAMQDPAYRRADSYTGAWGPSWLHRWAIGEDRPKEFVAGEPATARWVLDVAGIDSE
jgi:peptidoglycan/xylan/chitin deacetylase (PgdA/CDA1 family)